MSDAIEIQEEDLQTYLDSLNKEIEEGNGAVVTLSSAAVDVLSKADAVAKKMLNEESNEDSFDILETDELEVFNEQDVDANDDEQDNDDDDDDEDDYFVDGEGNYFRKFKQEKTEEIKNTIMLQPKTVTTAAVAVASAAATTTAIKSEHKRGKYKCFNKSPHI